LNKKVQLPINYGRQEITEADEHAVIDALRSDFLTQGPTVLEFEKAFAGYIGAKHAIAVTNGTAALHLSCLALGVEPGKIVLTTPITFAASANSVLYCGGHVEFIDIDPRTYCIDVEQLEKKIALNPSKYCGIIPVDYAGHPSDLPRIQDIANKYGLWVLEDSCHAPGALYSHLGKVFSCGSGEHSNLAIFSFHPVKHIATGEGGMVTKNDSVLYEKIKTLRTHGIVRDED
jgi:dTDP-4-amino-4,6-dideoxygalactose transaminase